MKKNIGLLLSFMIFSISIIGQNLNGKYIFQSEINGITYDYGIIELEIKKDSTYTFNAYFGHKSDLSSYLNWKKKSRNGVIKKKHGKKYWLIELLDEEEKMEIKITRNKIIIYGHNSNFKKVKGMELKKTVTDNWYNSLL